MTMNATYRVSKEKGSFANFHSRFSCHLLHFAYAPAFSVLLYSMIQHVRRNMLGAGNFRIIFARSSFYYLFR